MGTPFAPGQLNRLQNDVNVAVATALPKVALKLDPKTVLRALDGRGEILAGHMEAALEQAIGRMLMLMKRGSTTVTLEEPHNPDEFYRTRSGLYVWGEFRPLIVAKAKPAEIGMSVKAENFELMQDATDAEIESSLSKDHLFDETQVCVLIAGLVAKQPNGEARGALLGNGRVNLFYTGSCVVYVCWNAGLREWYVFTWQRDGHRCSAGNLVFSPGN